MNWFTLDSVFSSELVEFLTWIDFGSYRHWIINRMLRYELNCSFIKVGVKWKCTIGAWFVQFSLSLIKCQVNSGGSWFVVSSLPLEKFDDRTIDTDRDIFLFWSQTYVLICTNTAVLWKIKCSKIMISASNIHIFMELQCFFFFSFKIYWYYCVNGVKVC